jgi:hypothetical protein
MPLLHTFAQSPSKRNVSRTIAHAFVVEQQNKATNTTHIGMFSEPHPHSENQSIHNKLILQASAATYHEACEQAHHCWENIKTRYLRKFSSNQHVHISFQ